MVAFLLAEELFPRRPHYAPMDATALARYRILTRLGIFPVELNSPRGAVQFLRAGESILAANGVLWITPQGRFADPRARPLTFKPGLSALAIRTATRLGDCTLLPLAIEYPFWDERLPECLLRLGAPIAVPPHADPETLEATLRTALTAEMDVLAHLATDRNPTPFRTIISGTRGTGGLYALAQRLKSAFLRQPYNPDHTPERARPEATAGAESAPPEPDPLLSHPRSESAFQTSNLRVPHSCVAPSRIGGDEHPPDPLLNAIHDAP